jgi:hypothetical protein
MRALPERIALVALLAGVALCVHAQTPRGARLLETLQLELAQVRSLPAGERPTPPDQDMRSLIGTSRSEVLKALAAPSHCEPEDCSKSNSWRYDWGPPAPEPRSGDGYVTVTSGGPWLLVIEFSRDRAIAARWLGQR